ncbi:G2/M phase-specific E3 ubiquitin-protein ligase-like [Mytilus californianus]|uniref:G2/M phase-specific E3 ubiquitin-protein ligase-like n=1 Tax=Mytilus californianus TaxID=6549 RepID=UPI002246B207|nr:G2/M phase-specific E3 ubiquitin-protein ligase-like [Mytilus californianus]
MMGMVDGHFHTFGEMLGTILIQGGPIQDADYPERLMEDESVMNVLEAAGICQLERILCHRFGKPPKISAEILIEIVDVSTFRRSGSNARHNSEDVDQNFESFVHDCEDGTCTYDGGVVKVDDVLRFITGCSTVPPGGFDARFSIGFTEERKYPTVSTCTFEVVLPLHLKNYNTFKDIMIESIVSGPGFGQI